MALLLFSLSGFEVSALLASCLVEDCTYLGVRELLVDLGTGKSYELMAEIVDPVLVCRAVEDVLAAPVVRLDRKRCGFLVERNLVVVYGDL